MNSKKFIHEAGHIVFVHPSLMGGGAERVSLALASYFVAHGIRFTYLLTKSNIVEYDVPEGVEVRSEFASATLKPFDQIKLIRRFCFRAAQCYGNFLFTSSKHVYAYREHRTSKQGYCFSAKRSEIRFSWQ